MTSLVQSLSTYIGSGESGDNPIRTESEVRTDQQSITLSQTLFNSHIHGQKGTTD